MTPEDRKVIEDLRAEEERAVSRLAARLKISRFTTEIDMLSEELGHCRATIAALTSVLEGAERERVSVELLVDNAFDSNSLLSPKGECEAAINDLPYGLAKVVNRLPRDTRIRLTVERLPESEVDDDN